MSLKHCKNDILVVLVTCEWKSNDKRNCLLFVFRVTVGFFTHTINHSPGPCRKIEGKQVTFKSVSLPVSEHW